MTLNFSLGDRARLCLKKYVSIFGEGNLIPNISGSASVHNLSRRRGWCTPCPLPSVAVGSTQLGENPLYLIWPWILCWAERVGGHPTTRAGEVSPYTWILGHHPSARVILLNKNLITTTPYLNPSMAPLCLQDKVQIS